MVKLHHCTMYCQRFFDCNVQEYKAVASPPKQITPDNHIHRKTTSIGSTCGMLGLSKLFLRFTFSRAILQHQIRQLNNNFYSARILKYPRISMTMKTSSQDRYSTKKMVGYEVET